MSDLAGMVISSYPNGFQLAKPMNYFSAVKGLK